MHTPFFFAWFSYYMCVFLCTLFLIIHSCHVTKRNYWVPDWLMAGAYYWHKTSALAIALAASKLLLSEELAALPSLARPLHRLVKDGCWGWGYSSGWQGHSGSVVGFRFRHTHTHTFRYFSGETWLQPTEKLEIRSVRVCVCVWALLLLLWGQSALMMIIQREKNGILSFWP